ncbi:MAG: class V aminotransferase [Elusimicrobia bacterium RIFOXYC2_FULL_34_12]|nr:MAG: class V aminotransferase [Elusimicrobia bacterium RIFOXYC2_FULL_34_12]OGS37990.1 MAG: class V aminotransferase [Elusimicrobia bacterium RIFOXYD2_FULL_34_30]HAM38533.1 aminotransferase [Elusimicrobiota bacterium]
MIQKQYLMIPGPTMVPERILRVMVREMINHRGSEFTEMLKNVTAGTKKCFKTNNDLFIIPSSGTGGMEAAIVNILSEGDDVLVLNIGAFGSRFVKILKAYRANVDEIKFERGKAADITTVEKKLKEKKYKAVFFQQNETSTGVLNDVKALAEVIKKYDALVVVDSVSGLITADLRTDEWGLDVVVAASQKAFMLPPGLSFVSFSKKAWEYYAKAKMPRFYWDFKSMKDWADKGQNPFTPPVSLYYGLEEAIKMLEEQGLENVFESHKKLRDLTRNGLKSMGLQLLASDDIASCAVTAVFPPNGVGADDLRKKIKEKYDVILAGGQEELKGKIFRIGHLGFCAETDVMVALDAIKKEI